MKSIKTIRFRLLLILTFFIVSFLSSSAFAQNAKISGRVINERTSAPAAGATISVKNKNRSTTSDANGRFTIEASAGDELVITMVGYVKKEVVVDKSNTIEVKLVENVIQLD